MLLAGSRQNFSILFILLIISAALFFSACGILLAPYYAGKGVVKGAYIITRTVTKTAYGTLKVVYKIGEFTFSVVMAPLTWPFTRDGLESIDGLEPKEAIRQGRVKNSPYVVDGRSYTPMSLKDAADYRETGIASWYGYETGSKKGGRMTANGEVFNPEGLNAAHKYLPLPYYVRVTNLENKRTIIIRVNDRGPFVKGRIIDLSAYGAQKLGYYEKGTAKVLVEAIEVKEGG
jgi:rare lipoprotein A